MKKKTYFLQINLGIVLILCFGSCKNEPHQNSSVETTKTNIIPAITESVITKTLSNAKFTLNVATHFSNDTLDVIDYKEDPYSGPVILKQQIYFYENNKLIKEYLPTINSVKKRTISKTEVEALQTPLYKICLVKTDIDDFYVVHGSDYCNGATCPEFTGIFTMNGKVIYEGISTVKDKKSLKEILSKYKINLNNQLSCINLDNIIVETTSK